VLNLGLAILLAKAAMPVFDTAGDEVIEIGELALRAAALCGAASIPIHRPQIDVQNADHYVGDGRIYHALAQNFGVTLQRLDANILDTYAYIIGQRPPACLATGPIAGH